jgi:hypothetical protein
MQLGLSLAWRWWARPRRVVSEGSIPSGTTSLLIVRTGRIVTVVVATSSAGFSEFPAYSQVLLRLAFTQTLGPFTVVTPPSCDGVAGSFRFRPALTVAREVGPSHLAGRSAVELGVWPLRIPSIRYRLFHHSSFLRGEQRTWYYEIRHERDRYGLDGRPFLLIVRTGHIVTLPFVSDGMSSAGYSDVPAYSRVLQLPRSIVTAAVYRGLASALRGEAPNASA